MVHNEEGKNKTGEHCPPNVMDFRSLSQKSTVDLISAIGDKLISAIRFLLPGAPKCF